MTGGWSIGHMQGGWENSLQEGKRRSRENLTAPSNYLIRRYRKDGVRLFLTQWMDIRQWPQTWAWEIQIRLKDFSIVPCQRTNTGTGAESSGISILGGVQDINGHISDQINSALNLQEELGLRDLSRSSPTWFILWLSFYELHIWQLIFCSERAAVSLHLYRKVSILHDLLSQCC